MKYKIALFASGSGTNAEAITRHMQANPLFGIEVSLLITDKPSPPVVSKLDRLGVPHLYLSKGMMWEEPDRVLDSLAAYRITHIVLAGYLSLVPEYLVLAYPARIINIHPALLPKYGGAGMYGMHVHRAVSEAGETETGITIHEVDEAYDRGRILFQASAPIVPHASADEIAAEVHRLEQRHFPRVVAEWVRSLPITDRK